MMNHHMYPQLSFDSAFEVAWEIYMTESVMMLAAEEMTVMQEQLRDITLFLMIDSHLGIQSWDKNWGHIKHLAVEGDLFGWIVPHGPHYHHIPIPRIGETLQNSFMLI